MYWPEWRFFKKKTGIVLGNGFSSALRACVVNSAAPRAEVQPVAGRRCSAAGNWVGSLWTTCRYRQTETDVCWSRSDCGTCETRYRSAGWKCSWLEFWKRAFRRQSRKRSIRYWRENLAKTFSEFLEKKLDWTRMWNRCQNEGRKCF